MRCAAPEGCNLRKRRTTHFQERINANTTHQVGRFHDGTHLVTRHCLGWRRGERIEELLFTRVTLSGAFKDPRIPSGFAPFGIRNILGDLYVTFAKQDADRGDDVAGAGLGFVDVFDANGNLIRRIAARGPLNAPWGLALAPADFGQFSNRLLVGNFGDGTIDSFDAATGAFLGQLRGTNGSVLKVSNLWGLSFGNGLAGQPTNSLFFTSGPNDEEDGLYGRIDVAPGIGHEHGYGQY